MKRQQRIFLNKLLAIMLSVLMALPMNTIAWAADFSDGTDVTTQVSGSTEVTSQTADGGAFTENVDDIFGDGSNSSTETGGQNDTVSGNDEISTVDLFSSEGDTSDVEDTPVVVDEKVIDAYIDVKDAKEISYGKLYTELVQIYGKPPYPAEVHNFITYGGDFRFNNIDNGNILRGATSINSLSDGTLNFSSNSYYYTWRCTDVEKKGVLVNAYTAKYDDAKYIQFRTYYEVPVSMKDNSPFGADFTSSLGENETKVYAENSITLTINAVADYYVKIYDKNNTVVYSTENSENGTEEITYTYTPTVSTSLTIEYVKASTPKYNVSLNTVGSDYGTASLSSEGEIEEGSEITLTATPSDNGYISSVVIGETTLDWSEIKFNSARGIEHKFNVKKDITVTVTFAQKFLNKKSVIGTVGFNPKKSVSDQLDTLKTNIFNAVVDTDSSLPSGLTYSNLTYKYRPVGYFTGKLYDAIELTEENDYGNEFGARDFGSEETVVLTWPGDSQYPEVSIEATITLVESRVPAPIYYEKPDTVVYSTVDEIDEAVKNATSTDSSNEITVTRVSDVPATAEETELEYKISVAEDSNYLENEITVKVKVKAKENPATYAIVVNGAGKVTFAGSSETSGTLIAGDYSIVAEPTSDKGYVASITINNKDISSKDEKYTNRTFKDSITIANDTVYNIVVTFAERSITTKDTIDDVGLNGYLKPSEQKDTLKSNIYNAVVAGSDPSGISLSDVTIEFYVDTSINIGSWKVADYVDIDNDTLNLLNVAFKIGTEKIKITWPKTARYPEVSTEAEIQVVESRPTVTITPGSTGTLKVKALKDVTVDTVTKLLEDFTVTASNGTSIEFSKVTVTIDDDYALPEQGVTNDLTVTLTLAETAEYQAASTTTVIKVKNIVDKNNNDIDDDDETKYTVTYVGGTDDAVTNIPSQETGILSGLTVTVNTNAIPVRTPSEEGKTYSFVKWKSEDVNITADGTFIMPEKDVTLTALWSEDKYVTVTFKDGNDTVHTERINVTKKETVSSKEYDKDYAVLSGWYIDEKCEQKYEFGTTLSEDITLYAGWYADVNNNNIADREETGYIAVTVTGNGTVSLSAAENVNTIITETETGKYTVVYDSTVDNSNVITVTATPTDTDNSDGNVDYLISAPNTVTVKNNITETVNAVFGTESMSINKSGTIYINGNTVDSKKLDGLKEKVLTAAFGENSYEASEYTVYMVGRLDSYDVETTDRLEQFAMYTAIGLKDSLTFKIQKNSEHSVSDTITVNVEDSRYRLAVEYNDEIAVKQEDDFRKIFILQENEPTDDNGNSTVKDYVKSAFTVKYYDPTKADDAGTAVDWDKITITYKDADGNDYQWPANGKSATYTVTISVSNDLNTLFDDKYQNSINETLTLYVEDTTPMWTVIYTDGTETEEYFKNQTYEIVAESEIPVFQDKDGNETTPTREYYVFDKWEETKDSSTITYKATWKVEVDNNQNNKPDQTETYTVQYLAGYNNEDGNQKVLGEFEELAYGTDTPPIETPSRKNFFFAGWEPEIAATVTAPSEGTTITYTAKWNEKCTVTFVYGNGNENGTLAVEHNTAVTEPEAPTWTGHVFKYWYLKDADTAYDFETPVTDSITLIAKWGDDRNNNNIEDGTTEDPFHYYIWKDGESTLYEKNWLTGEEEITSDAYTYEAVSNDGNAFVRWEESVSEDGFTTTYTAVLVADVNNNEIPDEEETITINVITADDDDKIFVSENVKGTASSTDEETGATAYTYVYDSTKDSDIKLVATPVTEYVLKELVYKSKTYVDSVVLTNASSEEEQEAEEIALQAATGSGTYGDKYAYTYTFTPENGQTATVTFKIAEFDLKEEDERLMSYYYGQKDVKNEDVYHAIANAPAYADAEEVTITYKAREAMSQTVNIANLIDTSSTMGSAFKEILSLINLETITIDMDEVWQNVNVETDEDVIKDSVSLDDAVSKYFTEETINDLYAAYDTAYNAYLEENGTSLFDKIAAVAAGTAAITEKIESITDEIQAAAYYYNAHNFGYNPTDAETVTEEIKITYKSPAMYIETETTLKLKDTREASYLTGNNVSLTYKDYLDKDLIKALGIAVTDADGNAIEGAEVYSLSIKDPYTFEGKNVSDTPYEIVFKFAGNEKYKPSEATFEITIVKATAEMNLPEINVPYGTEYSTTPEVTLGNKYGEKSEITDDMIQFLVGLDVADLSVGESGVSGLNSKIQIFLPEDLQKALEAILSITGSTNEDGGIELSLSSLLDALELINIDSLEVLQQILDALQDIVDLGELKVVIGGNYPTDIGVYLYGAVSTNSNYETAYDVSYILITPKTERVYLDWDYKDSNGVFTHELLQYVDFRASAYVDENLTQKNETATEKVQSLIFGLDANGELVVELNKTSGLANGAYTQLAFIAEFGNEFNYAVPIVRAFAIIPNVVNVEIVDNEGTSFKRTFDNEGQAVDVDLTYDGSAITLDKENLTVTYTGVQTNGATYNSTEAPTHAGVYIVTATYLHKDANGNIIAVGMDIQPMIVMLADAEVTVDSEVIVYDGVQRSYSDYIHVTTDSGADPDVTIISASVASTGDFSENGWDAVEGSVNIDFPSWIDELLEEEGFEEGINATTLKAYLETLEKEVLAKIEALDVSDSVISSLVSAVEETVSSIVSVLEQMPEDVTLTFKDDVKFSDIGAYAVVAIVTDSDHTPAIDAGVIVVIPEVTTYKLKWNHEDENGIWTRELLDYEDVDLYAKAYDSETETKEDKEATAKIKYQFFGFDAEGNFISTDDASKLPNGVFTEMAYIPLEADADMKLSDVLVRVITITPSVVDVQFVDGEEPITNKVVDFDNTAKALDVKVSLGGKEIKATENLKVTYYGIQTNGKTYNSTTAPTHAGAYVVTAEYKEYTENDDLKYYGVAAAALVIKPVDSSITIADDTVVYDGEGHSLKVTATSTTAENLTPDYTLISGHVGVSGAIDTIGVDAFTANVNIDFPAWLDEVLADYEFKQDGITPAYLQKLMKDYKDDVFASSILEKVGVDEETIESMKEVYDQIIDLLEKMPKDISITFEDDITYTEPGYYLYYGIVTDSDHMPSTDSGVLEITKVHYRYGILDTYVPYNGKGQEPYKISETEDGEAFETDSFTMIVDRKTNTVNLLLEDDLTFVVDKLEELTGLNIKDGISLEELYEKVPVETLANLILTAIEGIEGSIDKDSDLYAMVELLKTELEKLPTEGSIMFNQPLPVNAGEYEFYTIAYSEHYETQVSQAVLTIMPIYITANDADKEKVYGTEDPDLTEDVTYSYYSYDGGEWKYYKNYAETKVNWVDVAEGFDIVNDEYFDNEEFVTLPEGVNVEDLVDVDVVRTEGEDVGLYDMTLSLTLKDESGNYVLGELTQDDKNFEIKPADITITVDDASKIYGEADPEFTYEITKGALVNGDDITFELKRQDGENVGTYPITVVTEDADGNDLYPNYNITVVPGELTITKKAVTLTVEDASKTYGDADPESFGYEVFETAFDDEITVEPTRVSGENVGNYAISVSKEQCDAYTNYDITVVDGTFIINKRDVVVTINDAFKVYGDTDPVGYEGVTVDNLVGEDTLTVTITRSNDGVEDVGIYENVLVANADEINAIEANSNYNVTEVVLGDFEILTRTVTIVSFEPVNRVYEEGNKTINVKVTVKGLDSENRDKEDVVDATASISRDDAAIYTGIKNLVLANENLKYEKTEALNDMLWDATVEIYPVKVVAALTEEVKTKEYDGTRSIVIEKEKVLSLTPAKEQGLKEGYELPSDLVVTYSYGGYEHEDAGETKVGVVAYLTKAEGSTLKLSNYALVETVIKDDATITPCKVTVTGLEAVDRDYEAGNTDVEIKTDNAVLVKVTSTEEETSNISAIIDGDEVGFTVTGSLIDPTEGAENTGAENAGKDKNVYLTMELTGRDKGNYELTVPEDLTVDINKLVIDSVSLGELKHPSRGTKPQEEITVPEDAKYEAALTWKDADGNELSGDDTFAVDKTYTAEVQLTLSDSTNYEFAGDLTIEGWEVTVNEDGTVTLTKEFSFENVEVLASSIDKKSGTTSVGAITVVNANASGENDTSYYTGDVVTATVERKENAAMSKFVGWYAGTAEGTDYSKLLSKNAEYTFTVEEDTYIWAVFEALEKVQLIIHGPAYTVSTPNLEAIQKGEYIAYYDVGTTITVTGVSEDGDFLYWKNDSEKITSTTESYTFTIVRNIVLNVVYNTEEQPYAKVEFINDTNQILNVASYTDGDEIEYPQIQPSKVGYVFKKWSMTEEEIWAAIESGKTWIRVVPEFEQLGTMYSVMVTYDGETSNPVNVRIGEKHTVEAKEIDNRKFSHWSDTADGTKVISTSKSYTFIVSGAKELYAIYVNMDDEVVQVPTMTIDIPLTETNPNKIIYLVERNVPDGYKLLRHGVLYSVSEIYAKDDADETMIDGAVNVGIVTSTDTAKAGIFGYYANVRDNTNKPLYVRGYMYILNEKTEKIEVIYSNIVSGSFNDFRK